jgi:predicted HAD superfamily Cof-like phosphohydrolase
MNEYLKKVAEFHSSFRQPILDSPTVPSEDRTGLRVNLISEELEELEEAIAKKDPVAVLDAFCDLQYVLSGAILEFGMQGSFDEAFNDVHRSNMSKLCNTREEAEETIDHHTVEHGVCFYEQLPTGKFIVFRESDKKVLKSKYYSPASLSQFIYIKAS